MSTIFFNKKEASTVTFTSGSGNWVVPDGVYQVWVEAWGGGGGGGGRGNTVGGTPMAYGGEASKSLFANISVIPGDSISYSIGVGGSGGTNADGNPGTDTSFGSLKSPGGVGGGQVPAIATSAAKPAGVGRNGHRGIGGIKPVGVLAFGGDGGYGNGGNGETGLVTGGNGGLGAGGGGAATTISISTTGGNGGNGRLQVWWVPE